MHDKFHMHTLLTVFCKQMHHYKNIHRIQILISSSFLQLRKGQVKEALKLATRRLWSI